MSSVKRDHRPGADPGLSKGGTPPAPPENFKNLSL